MFFGLDTEKILLIAVFAALIMGPKRLPQAAKWLAQMVVKVRDWSRTAKDKLKEEMGDDFDDVEWRKLDPRQYDPRRIVRDALFEPPASVPVSPARVEPVPSPSAPPALPAVALDPIDAQVRPTWDPVGEAAAASAPEPSAPDDVVESAAQRVDDAS